MGKKAKLGCGLEYAFRKPVSEKARPHENGFYDWRSRGDLQGFSADDHSVFRRRAVEGVSRAGKSVSADSAGSADGVYEGQRDSVG